METEEESEASSASQKPQGIAEIYSSPWHVIGWMGTIKGPELVANGVATGRHAGGVHCLSVIVQTRRRNPADVHEILDALFVFACTLSHMSVDASHLLHVRDPGCQFWTLAKEPILQVEVSVEVFL
jgi:hypothetical protein